MPFSLPELPYSYTALEPYIDAETMKLHYAKHHQSYVDKLNEALKDYPKYYKYTPEILVRNYKKLPLSIQEAVRNQGGGDVSHTMFWTLMKKNGGGNPIGVLAEQINKNFDSFVKFKREFEEAGTKHFGTGWVWLIFLDGRLKIVTLPNQDNPITNGNYPIMGLDLWEHSYYILYHNRRDDYLKALWNVLDWQEINQRFETSRLFTQMNPVNESIIGKQFGIK